MTPALFLAALMEALKSLPVIIQAFVSLKKLWDQSLEVSQRRAKMQELKNALDKASETKDTTAVEAFFRNLGK